MPVRAATNWVKAHGLTVIVALLFFFVSNLVTNKLTANTAGIRDVCAKVEAVRQYVDELVNRTTMSADQPPIKVADPAVQTLIDRARVENEAFKKFAAEQSKKAKCHL